MNNYKNMSYDDVFKAMIWLILNGSQDERNVATAVIELIKWRVK